MLSYAIVNLIANCGAIVMDYNEVMRRGIPMGFHSFFAAGFYDPRLDFIGINLLENGVPFDFVAMHELIHWSGHSSRLNRRMIAMTQNAMDGFVISDLDRHTEEATAIWGMYYLAVGLGFDERVCAFERDKQMQYYPIADLTQAKQDAEIAANYLLAMVNQVQAA